ncbi:MAG: hypothetical protein U0Y68_14845 [Blastocatellia bacterium]
MKKYDNEFKAQAVKKILEGQSVASVSEVGVAEGFYTTLAQNENSPGNERRTGSAGIKETTQRSGDGA